LSADSPSRSATVAAWIGLAASLVLLLVPLPVDRDSPTVRALQDALHLPGFALFTVLLDTVVRGVGPRRALPATLWIAGLVAGLTELVQHFSARTPSWSDFFHNLLGIGAGCMAVLVWRSPRCRRWRIPFGLGLTAAVIGAGSLPWLGARDAIRRQAEAFPMLGDFEAAWEERVWIPQGKDGRGETRAVPSPEHATHGSRSLEVTTVAAAWAGVRVIFETPPTWSRTQGLCFDLHHPGDDAFQLGIRIDAADGERFTAEATVPPGTSHHRIVPANLRNRRRSLAESGDVPIKAVVFHLGDHPLPRRFHLDRVRLE
jgi:hypothetical protein